MRVIWTTVGYTPKIALADATFGGEIQVRIDVRGRRNVAVTQPLLDFFQADPVCIQKACAAMPQIVETNLPHTVLFKHQREMLGDIAGFYKLSDPSQNT